MATDPDPDTALSAAEQRALAVSLFNGVWRLLETERRTPEQDDEMIHMAHASRYHWGPIGTAANRVRGEWQCSRVYATLGRAEPAQYHARRALEICQQHGIGDFDLAFCYEALARASAIAGDADESARWTARAVEATEQIGDPEDRDLVRADLATISERPPGRTIG
ncbi:MAG TPA: hypothetical protein VKG85_09620 [Actinomycetes bacterium]|nr:hypothetical protein [Actinomycetes bacterium]